MSPATTLDHNVMVSSMDEPVACTDGDGGDNLTLGDMLADHGDDPCTLAGRNIDWSLYMDGLDKRDTAIIHATAAGTPSKDLAKRFKLSQPRITQKKRRIGRVLQEKSHGRVMSDAVGRPLWKGNLTALHARTTRWRDLDGLPACHDLAQAMQNVPAA